MAARDHARSGVQRLRRERYDEILGVVAGHREHAGRALDTGGDERIVGGRIGMDVRGVRMLGQILVEPLLVDFDDHERPAGHRELARDVVAHAADAAEDVVARERIDHVQHPSALEGRIELSFEDEDGERGHQVADRADAGDRDRDREHAPARTRGEIDDLAVADRGDRDERHVESVDERRGGSADRAIAERSDQEDQREQCSRPHEAAAQTLGDGEAHKRRL